MARKDDLALVAATLRRARLVQGMLAAVALAATVVSFFLWWEAGRPREPWADAMWLLLCAGFGWLAARFAALFRLRRVIEASAVYVLLRDQPERVRWMFPRTTYLRVGTFSIGVEKVMIVLTDDGKAHEIHGIRNEKLAELEKAVRRLAPRADYGLSEKNRRRYQHATGLIVR